MISNLASCLYPLCNIGSILSYMHTQTFFNLQQLIFHALHHALLPFHTHEFQHPQHPRAYFLDNPNANDVLLIIIAHYAETLLEVVMLGFNSKLLAHTKGGTSSKSSKERGEYEAKCGSILTFMKHSKPQMKMKLKPQVKMKTFILIIYGVTPTLDPGWLYICIWHTTVVYFFSFVHDRTCGHKKRTHAVASHRHSHLGIIKHSSHSLLEEGEYVNTSSTWYKKAHTSLNIM